jgi:two-component system cell cycle response regulator DivK
MAKILIVEDNPDNLKLFRAILAMKGHLVTALSSGEGLLGTIAESKPDLLLMDIQLPGKDGYELLKDVRNSQWRSLGVIALTAHARGQDEDRARDAGFDGYITKPIDIATFPEQVDRALARQPLS